MLLALRFLPYALSGLAVLAVWWLWSDRAALQAEKARLTRELAVQARVIAQAQQARDVEQARVEWWRTRANELDANIQAIVDGGIPDAPLDPRLADLINSRLRDTQN